MAFNRTRHSPGIEINEIDKSKYSTLPDYSIVNTITFAPGFASKGPDYTTIWVNSMKTFVDTYGYPTNDPEKFLYYTAKEILSKGGVMLASKLPYSNESKDAYSYVDYDVTLQGLNAQYLSELSSVDQTILSSLDITFHDKLYSKYKIEKLDDGCTIADITNTIHNIVTCDQDIDGETLQNIIAHITTVSDAREMINIILQEINNGVIPTTDEIKNLADLRNRVSQIVTQIANSLSVDLKLMPIDELDKCIVNRKNLQPSGDSIGKIRIIDRTRSQYGKFTAQVQQDVGNASSMFVDKQLECLGIMPVIVTPMNALLSQGIITLDNAIQQGSLNNYEYTPGIERYNAIRDFRQFASIFPFELTDDNLSIPFKSDNQYEYTLSQVAAKNFPTIRIKQNPLDKTYSGFRTSLDREYLKFITVIVFEVYADKSNNNKLAFSPVETFTGSLDPECKNENGSSLFIDDIVNSQSEMIYLFSNINGDAIDKADIVKTSEQVATSLGFSENQCVKHIDYKESILDSLDVIFETNKNSDVTGIDLVVDAGVTNIAANEWLRKAHGESDSRRFEWHIDDQSATNSTTKLDEAFMWRTVVQKYVDFCRYTRKDCMAIIDGIRRFCLNGEQKRVRDTLRGSTIENQINPLLKYMPVIDSSYAAGYCNWFRVVDDMSGEFLWLPPSIKAAGIYTYSDAYYTRWSAPAGINRGPVAGAVDIAFNPIDDEAGKIYDNGWNYAVSYPLYGIILEGQKTFQVSKSAFDRVNVRRLFLYLEKQVKAAARYFVYEHNTAYQRQQFVDRIKPLFESVKKAYGIADYVIKCDESINTPEVINDNTMRCVIGIRPIKVVEWIVCDFVCTNQSVSVTESIQGL